MEGPMFGEGHMHMHKRWREMRPGQRILVLLKWLGFFAVIIAFNGLLVMLLWNAVMARILGLPAFNYWEAVGLLILFRVLMGGRMGPFIGRMRMRRLMRERRSEDESDSGEGKID